jgi:hypothetical protein
MPQFERFGGDLAPLAQETRRPNTDAEVTSFIKERLVGKRQGYTVLLREFRKGGLACEQHRFKQLYTSVVGSQAK